MIFRKHALLFYQSEIFYIVLAMLCLALIPMIGLGISLLYGFPIVILLFVNPKLHQEFIIINEKGILCRKAETLLWEYGWDSIAELKESARFLMPSIEVITYDEYGKPEQIAMPDHYFQLSGKAKKAIGRYCARSTD